MENVAKNTKSAKGFQLTCNEIDKLADVLAYLRGLNPNYLLAGQEDAPSTGHKHAHIYVQFPNARRLSLKKLLGTHVEKALGSPKQNIAYVKKEGAEIVAEEGAPRLNYVPSIKEAETAPIEDLKGLNLNYFNIVKKIEEKRAADLTPAECFKEVAVYWYWGESGAGKTRAAMKAIGDRKFNMVKFESGFWHGIGAAEIALYDDWRDTHMKPTELINFIDYYVHPMNVKGGSVRNLYKEVYITSIQDPESIYSNMKEEYKKQWLRRIKEIVNFKLINM
jgi:hypothetical protein